MPAVQCPKCAYPNDSSFSFCQRCGYCRKLATSPAQAQCAPDLVGIDSRLKDLKATAQAKPYEKQKNSLQVELEDFLSAPSIRKSIMEATPNDITRFLVWKDRKGKTKVHVPACCFFGSKTPGHCPCPTRLAAGTVDTIIGKLRSIFIDLGRVGDWREAFGSGNPATDKAVRQYLRLIREEQAVARITPKQASPVFLEKLITLCVHLKGRVFSSGISPIQRFLFARDLAFFNLDFFAGDRASDLGRIFTKEVMSSSDGATLLFRHTFGKTLRGKDTNSFMVKRGENISICPITNLRLYIQLCDLMGVNLRDGYLFRISDKKGHVSDAPFTGSAVASRLTLHLKTLNIHQGETMHSFRGGCAITLSLLGVSQQDVARHVGWKSMATADYYTQCDKVMDPGRAASALATASGGGTNGSTASVQFQSNNNPDRWTVAFP